MRRAIRVTMVPSEFWKEGLGPPGSDEDFVQAANDIEEGRSEYIVMSMFEGFDELLHDVIGHLRFEVVELDE